MLLIFGAAVLFVEPLIDQMREMTGLAGAHPAPDAEDLRSSKRMARVALGVALLIASMSHELVHNYLLADLLKKNGIAAFKMGAAVVTVFGTTLVWTYGARRGQAWLLGGVTALALAGCAFGAYLYLEPTLYSHIEASESELGVPMGLGFRQSPGGPAAAAKPVERRPVPGEASGPSLASVPPTAPARTEPPPQHDPLNGGGGARSYYAAAADLVHEAVNLGKAALASGYENFQKIKRPEIAIAVLAWFPVGLFGGWILDRRWGFLSASTVLAGGIVLVTGLSDALAQAGRIALHPQAFSSLEVLFWIALGIGWGSGIFILGRSADLVFGERK